MEASFLPFAVLAEDVARLDACEAFQSIRRNAASQHGTSYGADAFSCTCRSSDHRDRFCHDHNALGSEDRDAWLLHRDIVHALILPVLRIHGQASRLADFVLRPNVAVDRELAFRGEARGAFSWLQCLLSDEVDFSCTEGCPGRIHQACVVSAVFFADTVVDRSLRRHSRPTLGAYHTPNPCGFSHPAVCQQLRWFATEPTNVRILARVATDSARYRPVLGCRLLGGD